MKIIYESAEEKIKIVDCAWRLLSCYRDRFANFKGNTDQQIEESLDEIDRAFARGEIIITGRISE